MEAYKKAVGIDPEFASPYNNLATIALRQGWLEQADSLAKKAIELEPTLGDAYNTLGNVRSMAGEYDEAKALYLKDLSARIVEGSLDLDGLRALPDEEVIAQLIAVRGIGRWTAEMFLIFSLGRLDVWPVDDLGIVIAAQGLYDLPARPTRRELQAIGEPLRPYRTLAAWYLWQHRRVLMETPR